MNSSQVFLAKSILQALIKYIDLENRLHGEKVQIVWENLPEGLANYVGRLLMHQQLLH